MAAVQPGDYITAKCRRCDDITGHVVMIVVGGQILRVECKACGSVHKYRDTAKPAGKRAETSVIRHVRAGQNRDQAVEKGRRTPAPSASAAPKPVKGGRAKGEAAWQEAMLRLSGQTPQAYSMDSAFSPQTLVEHPVFGKGIVLEVIKPDKVNILFEEGSKTLRCRV